jgi:PPOX class probable F420-dependent enzyme
MTEATSQLDPAVRRYLREPGRLGVLATVNPSGAPHQCVVWYRLTDGDILLNSAEGRRWPANLRRDGRASLMVADPDRYVVVRGTAEVVAEGEPALADIVALGHLYHPGDPSTVEKLVREYWSHQHRVSFLLRPQSVGVHEE